MPCFISHEMWLVCFKRITVQVFVIVNYHPGRRPCIATTTSSASIQRHLNLYCTLPPCSCAFRRLNEMQHASSLGESLIRGTWVLQDQVKQDLFRFRRGKRLICCVTASLRPPLCQHAHCPRVTRKVRAGMVIPWICFMRPGNAVSRKGRIQHLAHNLCLSLFSWSRLLLFPNICFASSESPTGNDESTTFLGIDNGNEMAPSSALLDHLP